MDSPLIDRRSFLRVMPAAAAVTAAACAPAAPAAAPTAAQPAAGAPSAVPAWEKEWQELVEAAKKEGTVAVFTTGVGSGYRKFADTFEEAFPGIKVDLRLTNTSGPFVEALTKERAAGIYAVDINLSPASITIPTQRAPGFLEPIRPLLFRPDVLDEKAWLDGIQWLDNDKKWSFMFQSVVNLLLINSDLVKDGEIKTAADLLDPKWKGKITASDPRMSTFWGEATAMRTAMGDAVFTDAMKRLIKDQGVAFQAQARQRAEGMIRGQYALGWGVPRIDLKEFTDAGLGKNLKYIQVQGFSYVPCTGIWFYNRAPHPSAAKLFANWILTKAGQQAWSTNAQTNVRRLDVQPFDPERLPPPGNKYIFLGDETSITSTDQTQKIINQVLQS